MVFSVAVEGDAGGMNLFRHAAFFTDIHFGLKSNSEAHNTDCQDFVAWMCADAKARGCETCFFLGDFHHNRNSINVVTLRYSLRAVELLNASFDQVFFLTGNHDHYYRDQRTARSVE